MKRPSIVEPKLFPLFSSRNIHLRILERLERWESLSPKESNLFRKVQICCKKIVLLLKRNSFSMRIENATASFLRQNNAVFYESQTNYSPLEM